ncbi:alpha-1,6-mannosyltransferase [Propionibacterium cyclohexanicum]|uniref:Alpha-1,6-mannosyltransferase n=2 Tax=Propionibacterium cyclohexanicum TaxID=64702 RepID=A0A1H9S4Y5_9ACTN|nr:alpha-1,6-mannosyltransferase [Propionibacterium cyclohexanicum]
MRIAQLANFVGPASGGMRVAITALGEGYVAAGHERMLVVPGPEDSERETPQGLVVTIRSPKVSSAYRMVARPWQAEKALERFAPTNIECSDKMTLASAARWAARCGVGSVLFSHERLDDMISGWMRHRLDVSPVVSVLDRHLARLFDRVVVTSHYSAGEFASTEASLRLVPLGVDLATFNPHAGLLPGGEPPRGRPLRLCLVGRLSHEKSPDLAVRTAVELHRRGVPIELHVFGGGPDELEMHAAAQDAPVFFHGFVADRAELAARVASCDISLSVCPTETFGLAVLEALACGTPVVTADRGGARELVSTDCGESGAPEPSCLADAVLRLAARPRRAVRLAARRRAEGYGWPASVAAMLSIHDEVAAPAREC